MGFTEYKPGSTFPGVIGRTTDESSPAWPQPVRATPGAPNVLLIVLDDTGFGHLGCYGSPIATPNLDALAAGGLLYTNMHTTALCSPSRSCIITGRNHHAKPVVVQRPGGVFPARTAAKIPPREQNFGSAHLGPAQALDIGSPRRAGGRNPTRGSRTIESTRRSQ